LVAWTALVEHLEPAQITEVGQAILAASRDRLRTTVDPAVVRREQVVIRFVTALFGL
jgi:hypothetical protein